MISFIDNADLHANRRFSKENIQRIMNICTELCEIYRIKIQQNKTLFFSWRWIVEEGHRIITQTPIKIKVYDHVIK